MGGRARRRSRYRERKAGRTQPLEQQQCARPGRDTGVHPFDLVEVLACIFLRRQFIEEPGRFEYSARPILGFRADNAAMQLPREGAAALLQRSTQCDMARPLVVDERPIEVEDDALYGWRVSLRARDAARSAEDLPRTGVRRLCRC